MRLSQIVSLVLGLCLLQFSSISMAGGRRTIASVPPQIANLVDLGLVTYESGMNGYSQIFSPVTSDNPVIVCQPDWYMQLAGWVHESEFVVAPFYAQPQVKYVLPLNLVSCRPGGIDVEISNPYRTDSSLAMSTSLQVYIEDAATGAVISARNSGGCNYKGNWGFVTSELPAQANLVIVNTAATALPLKVFSALEITQSMADGYCSLRK